MRRSVESLEYARSEFVPLDDLGLRIGHINCVQPSDDSIDPAIWHADVSILSTVLRLDCGLYHNHRVGPLKQDSIIESLGQYSLLSHESYSACRC